MANDGKSPCSTLKRLVAFALGAWLGLVAQTAHGEPFPAMNSYGQPPFVQILKDRNAGLASTFVDLVNQALDGRYEFRLENLPRRRLELTLTDKSFTGVALFLAPEFLSAPSQQGAAWSEPVMIDENLIVSMRPLTVTSLQDLHELKFGGIAGHIYRLLVPAIEAGKLSREDAPDHLSNLRKLCLGRVDFVVISKSELAGTRPHASCPEPFKIAAFPEPQVIVRRVLVRIPNHDSENNVLGALAAVACSKEWVQALSQHGLSTTGCRNSVARAADIPPSKVRKSSTSPTAEDRRS